MWTCSSGAADNCVGSDLYDPPVRTVQGESLCFPCARALGLITPHGSERDSPGRSDLPYGQTD
ncbi:hypothetical protein [Salinilacihabitans rarus]|uniref:hypothetical protein n=1 Tax=Salinilacihabitans rarus TaxID=2961596 RepID=UPI0020C8D1C6|nr:hypothetical protein [Salinilacihabitans rarus]